MEGAASRMSTVKLISWLSPYVHRAEVALRLPSRASPTSSSKTKWPTRATSCSPTTPSTRRSPCSSTATRRWPSASPSSSWSTSTRPSTARPSDLLSRAAARFWARFVDDKLWKALWAVLWAEAGEAWAREAKETLTLLEAQLPAGKSFFGGDAIGFLDIAASGVALWLPVFEEMAGVQLLAEETHLALCRWAREYTAEEAVRQCTPDRAKVLAFLTPKSGMFVSTAKAMAAQM